MWTLQRLQEGHERLAAARFVTEATGPLKGRRATSGPAGVLLRWGGEHGAGTSDRTALAVQRGACHGAPRKRFDLSPSAYDAPVDPYVAAQLDQNIADEQCATDIVPQRMP